MSGKLFSGVPWLALDVGYDGECRPAAKTICRDVLRVYSQYHLGPGVYSVVNFSKGQVCTVQLLWRQGAGPISRCDHVDCVRWQHTRKTPCKHIRAACRWHIRLARRLRIKRAQRIDSGSGLL